MGLIWMWTEIEEPVKGLIGEWCRQSGNSCSFSGR